MDLLELQILGNLVRVWLAALVLAIGLYSVLMLVRQILRKRFTRLAAREQLDWTDLASELLGNTRGLFILFVSLTIALLILDLSDAVRGFLRVVLMMVLLFQAGLWAVNVVEYYIARRIAKSDEDVASQKTTLNALGVVAKLAVWTLVVIMALDNLPNVDVTSLITGLGIGGIAVGLAVQNILGDLFSSLTIALDKPFRIDDSINVGDFSGKVEHIGLKSTRVRSFSGEQVVFSNSDLLNSRLRNYQSMVRRRVVVTLGVSGKTSYKLLQKIPLLLKEIVDGMPDTNFDRAHFREYGEYALLFELVYYIESDNYTLYMDRQQAINLEIFHRFAEEGIEMPYPTSEVIVTRK